MVTAAVLRKAAVGAATAVLLIGGGSAVAAAGGSATASASVYQGCLGPSGQLHAITVDAAAAPNCPSGERLITWNQTGPQGTQGPGGADGPQGPQGPKGDSGAIGPQGPQGATGPTGPQGADGRNGATILNGTGSPTTQGSDGDFYLDTATSTLYGPKAGGSWPAQGTSLIGTQGPKGDTGAQGAAGADGPQGPVGPEGPAGAGGALTYTGTATGAHAVGVRPVRTFQTAALPGGDWDVTWSVQGTDPDGGCELTKPNGPYAETVAGPLPLAKLPNTFEYQTGGGESLSLGCTGSGSDTITGFSITLTERTQHSLGVTVAP